MSIDLTMIWAAIIASCIMAYVVLDGFDLGIGILLLRLDAKDERDIAINSVAPVWDGNETWLVLGGGGLLAAFPLAYSIILPALYAPLIAMLLGLILRGVAFEFRHRDPAHKAIWDVAFSAGSTIAALCQGIALGALLQGISVTGRAYSGGWWEWLSPFTLLCGASLVIGYSLLGSCWLIYKTQGALQNKFFSFARLFGLLLLLAIGLVSLATPFLETKYYLRWFSAPGIYFAALVPLAVALCAYQLWQSLAQRKELSPFLYAIALFGLCFAGLAISIWPDVIPARVTIWQAATDYKSQLFMIVGVAIMLPIILAYTTLAYWVFRGKATKEGYH
ncbi:MAG: cytochrome d ubiquinol oxidase subunit II [Pseudomonadota bacterium]|nr:cytochrome d ubiquinol oxidase subunit II [Pseudomonadota bacterium]